LVTVPHVENRVRMPEQPGDYESIPLGRPRKRVEYTGMAFTLPKRAIAYVYLTAALGSWALGSALFHWRSHSLLQFWCYLAIAMFASTLKVRLPGIESTMSVHFLFILLGILAGTAQGYQAAMFYTITYVIVAAGAFGMIVLLSRRGFEADALEDFKGLNARSPWFAGMMAILMFSLAGVPPFIGFYAKLWVIQAVLGIGNLWLAVVAVLFSVVGAYYYLRILKLMYFDEPVDKEPLDASGLVRTVLSLNALFVLGLGILPATLLALCKQAFP